MKRIVVPTDFSATAAETLKFALEVANASQGEILLLHVLDMPLHYTTDLDGFDYTYNPKVVKVMYERAESQYKAWKEKFFKNSRSVQFFVEEGPVFLTIERFAKKKKADLIMMGTHGASGFKEFFIGSNAEKVVRFSKIPVMVIPKAIKLSSIKSIIFPTRLSLKEMETVKRIKTLQDFFKAHLHVIHINTPVNFKRDRELKALLRDYVKHYKLKNYSTAIVNDAYEQAGIISYAQQLPASMIAMATHARKGLGHFFAGSVAEDVVNHIDRPVWTHAIKK